MIIIIRETPRLRLGRHRLKVRRIGVFPGVCRICRCTEDRACGTGCWWVDRACTLCSRCSHNMAVLAFVMRKARPE
jgi:hypothetical protein